MVPYNNGNTDYTDDAPFMLNANNIVVDAGGSISADSQGYTGAINANGNGPGGGETKENHGFSGKGGSYSSLGGNSNTNAGGGASYGSIQEPTDLGSAGGSGAFYGYFAGGNGGGAIKLVVNDTLTVNGTLSANGGTSTGVWQDTTWNGAGGGGSGGSLWLTVETIAGSGLIEANGGDTVYGGGGGSGGRIALYYDEATFPVNDATHLQSFGGASGTGGQYGGPGTVFLHSGQDDADGVLQLNNQQTAVSQPVILSGTADGAMTFDKVTVGANTVLLLVPYNNGNTDYTDDAPFTLNANDIVIDAGGSINSDSQGYTAVDNGTGYGPGGGETSAAGRFGSSGRGGGYSSAGDASSTGAGGGAAYGSSTEPTDLGSAGGGGNYYGHNYPAGNGGGAIKLVVEDTLTINGSISANGGAGKGAWEDDAFWNGAGGGGSGGSIWLKAGSVIGNGVIQAKGGDGIYGSGGGAGGRIAIEADTLASTISISAAGGSGYASGGSGSTNSVIESGTPVPTPNGTPTETPTPTLTLTPTQTRTPKPTATTVPGTPDQVASFTYDGDGNMVKAVIGGVTTVYVNPNYQIKDGVVTKYYQGGAMRVGDTLYYTLSDNLGSTSITIDPSGNKTETRYNPWGEVRYQSGTLPTDRTYTGQRSYTDDFGLMYYNARWYDFTVGRFAQADVIASDGPQGLDRYAYVDNNPVMLSDPTGNTAVCSDHDYGGHIVTNCPDDGKDPSDIPQPTSCGNQQSLTDCQAAYETLKALIKTLWRMPTMEEIIRMTVRTEAWPGLKSSTASANADQGLNDFQEGLARAYYGICGSTGADCKEAGDKLYLFLSGYQPWLGRKCSGNGYCEVSTAKAASQAAMLNYDRTYEGDGTTQDLNTFVGDILKPKISDWTNGRNAMKAWQWYTYDTNPFPNLRTFGVNSVALLMVTYIDPEKHAIQYMYFYTGEQTNNAPQP